MGSWRDYKDYDNKLKNKQQNLFITQFSQSLPLAYKLNISLNTEAVQLLSNPIISQCKLYQHLLVTVFHTLPQGKGS